MSETREPPRGEGVPAPDSPELDFQQPSAVRELTAEELLERYAQAEAAKLTTYRARELKVAGGCATLAFGLPAILCVVPSMRPPSDILLGLTRIAALGLVFLGIVSVGLSWLERRLSTFGPSLLQDVGVALAGAVLASSALAFVIFDYVYATHAFVSRSAVAGFLAVDRTFRGISTRRDSREITCLLAILLLPFPFMAVARGRRWNLSGQTALAGFGSLVLAVVIHLYVLPEVIPWLDDNEAHSRKSMIAVTVMFLTAVCLTAPSVLLLVQWLGSRLWRPVARWRARRLDGDGVPLSRS